MRKLSESVWGDIRKKSLGQEVRTETPIGDYSFDQFYKYLKEHYETDRDDRITIGRNNTGRHITATIFIQNKNRVELSIGEDPSYATCLDIIRNRMFEENVERRIKVFSDLIRVEFDRTKLDLGDDTKLLISQHKDRPESRNSIYLRVLEMVIIGLTLQTENPSILCIKRKKGQEFLGESVWGDLRKKSLGQEERIEDDINLFTRERFYEYLVDNYEVINQNKYDIDNIGCGTVYVRIPVMRLGRDYPTMDLLWDPKRKFITLRKATLNNMPINLKKFFTWDCAFEMDKSKDGMCYIRNKDGDTNNKFMLDVIDFVINNVKTPTLRKK